MKNNSMEIVTSRVGLHLWRISLSLIIFILCTNILFFALSIQKSDNQIDIKSYFSIVESNKVLSTLVLLVLLSIVVFLLLRIVIYSRHLKIKDQGIEHSGGLIKWSQVDKVTAYRGYLPIISIKLKNSRPSKLIGVFSILTGKKSLQIITNILSNKGITLKRWLV
jgi:hypothetical protein